MKLPVNIDAGLDAAKVVELAKFLGFEGSKVGDAAKQMTNLYNLFLKVDATQVEINPLGETDDGRVVCFDAKINFDDNAEFRQKDIFAMNDTAEDDPREVKAAKHGL